MVNSTIPPRSRKPSKPEKPYAGFPLTPHPSGRWCKKIKGKLHYYGPWNDPDGALDNFKADMAGKPRSGEEGATLRDLVNRFLTTKKMLLESGELSPYTFKEYHNICAELVNEFGADRLLTNIGPDAFERLRATWAQKWGPVRLASEINRAKVVFRYAWEHARAPAYCANSTAIMHHVTRSLWRDIHRICPFWLSHSGRNSSLATEVNHSLRFDNASMGILVGFRSAQVPGGHSG